MPKTLLGLHFPIAPGQFASKDVQLMTTWASAKDHGGRKEMSPSNGSCSFILKYQNKMIAAPVQTACPYNTVTSERKVKYIEGKPV